MWGIMKLSFFALLLISCPVLGQLLPVEDKSVNYVPAFHKTILECSEKKLSADTCNKTLELALKKNIDINEQDTTMLGFTAVHLGVMSSNLGVLKFLHSKKANLSLPAKGPAYKGKTPLQFANALGSNKEILEFLKNSGAK
jgi:hypothetical protein